MQGGKGCGVVCQSVMLLLTSKLILSMPILGSTTTISGSYSHIHHTYINKGNSPINKYFELKKLVGRQWGAPNSNYLLVTVSTFVMPFSMDPLSPRMTPGCIMQKYIMNASGL